VIWGICWHGKRSRGTSEAVSYPPGAVTQMGKQQRTRSRPGLHVSRIGTAR
jgi:hypothetical protein